MKVTRLYTGEDGKSHFEEVEYELYDSPVGRVSERIEATGVIFRGLRPTTTSTSTLRRGGSSSSTWMRRWRSRWATVRAR